MDQAIGNTTAPARMLTTARVAALVLICAPLLELLGMAHHPTVNASDAAGVAAGLRESARLAAEVHGFLIALLMAILLGFSEFSVWRGLSTASVRAALITYATGVVLLVCAALVSGFVTPRIADIPSGTVLSDDAWVARLAAAAMLFNQAFARCGTTLMSFGISLWSVDLIKSGDVLLGGLGVLLGFGGALAVGFGVLHLDVHGMTAVAALEAVWTMGVGCLLFRSPPRCSRGHTSPPETFHSREEPRNRGD